MCVWASVADLATTEQQIWIRRWIRREHFDTRGRKRERLTMCLKNHGQYRI